MHDASHNRGVRETLELRDLLVDVESAPVNVSGKLQLSTGVKSPNNSDGAVFDELNETIIDSVDIPLLPFDLCAQRNVDYWLTSTLGSSQEESQVLVLLLKSLQ